MHAEPKTESEQKSKWWSFFGINSSSGARAEEKRKNSVPRLSISSVAIHKLRDSKWFGHEEENIFLAVIESGFIVERKTDAQDHQTHWGVAFWKDGKEKSKNSEYIYIYSLIEKKGKSKVTKQSLSEFWPKDNLVRINNRSDKEKKVNNEFIIREQINTAIRSGQSLKWQSAQHFALWCRYGPPRPEDPKTKKSEINANLKWGNVGFSAGMVLLSNNNNNTGKRKRSNSVI